MHEPLWEISMVNVCTIHNIKKRTVLTIATSVYFLCVMNIKHPTV